MHIYVSGKVQGVGFRWSLQRKAREFMLTGWVRNLSDGRVESVIEGERGKIEQIIKLAESSKLVFTRIERVEVIEEECSGEFRDFEIKL